MSGNNSLKRKRDEPCWKTLVQAKDAVIEADFSKEIEQKRFDVAVADINRAIKQRRSGFALFGNSLLLERIKEWDPSLDVSPCSNRASDSGDFEIEIHVSDSGEKATKLRKTLQKKRLLAQDPLLVLKDDKKKEEEDSD